MKINLSNVKRSDLFIALVAMVTAVIYSYGFKGAFAYDDYHQILNRPQIQNIFNLHDVIFNGLRQHRMWQNLSFGLNWTISGGATWSFKLFSLIFHLMNSWILLMWLKRLFSDRPLLPVFAAALFLIHPLQIQSVTYVMGVTTLIQSFFYLLSLYWYSKYRLSRMGGLLTILFLSLFSKETAVFIPLVLAAYEFLLIRKPGDPIEWKKWGLVFFIPILMIPIYMVLKDPASMYDGVTGFELFPFFPYIGAQFYYQIFYFNLIFNPTLQAIIHDIPVYSALPIFLAVLGGALWVWSVYFLFTRFRQYPRICLLLLIYYVSYIPTNTFLQMVNPFAEYRLYLTNMVLFVGLVWIILDVSSWLKKKGYFQNPEYLIHGSLAMYFAIFTWLNVMIWKSEVKIFEQSVKLYPEGYIPNRSLGVAYVHEHDYENALYFFMITRFIGGSLDPVLKKDLLVTSQLLYNEGKFEKAWLGLEIIAQDGNDTDSDEEFKKTRDLVKAEMTLRGLSLDSKYEEFKSKYGNLMKHRHFKTVRNSKHEQ